jgi:hypothetical protein
MLYQTNVQSYAVVSLVAVFRVSSIVCLLSHVEFRVERGTRLEYMCTLA